MKQKVGVITFHEANNYGAVLQAVALQKALVKVGSEPHLINYRPKTEYGFKIGLSLRNIPYIPFIKHKERTFNRFLKRNAKFTKVAKNKNDLKVIKNKFDCIITGSDQVFNPKWRNGDTNYILSFADNNQRYSYAASFGISELPLEWSKTIAPLLSDYNTISVRETSAVKIIENLGLKARIDCDPVLLLSKDEWLKLSKTNRLKPYLLLYTLESNDELLSFARKIAKEQNLQIVQLTDSLRSKKGDIHYFSFRSPEEYIGAFAKASYIVTNSFHGLAFSTLLEKDFTVFLQNKNGAPNARLTDFVNKYQISDRVFGQGGEKLDAHNFELTRQLIKEDAENSYSYLKTFGKTNLVLTKSNCAYCGACANVCPVNAITYKLDLEGNKYPQINLSKCVSCNACEQVCPYTNAPIKNNVIKTLGFANSSDDRLSSRSGGLFITIAKGIINQNGVVYGAVLNKNNKIEHLRATTISEVEAMQKSKYVVSNNFEKVITSIINDLNESKTVFVSGTPCFINAVNTVCKYKNVDVSKLLTMDLVCHGTPTSKIFESYIKKIETKYGPISSFQFRDKEKGWNTHFESFVDSNGSKHYSQEYADIFYSHSFQRPSCYNCKFSNTTRPSDITGADFWGGNKLNEFSDNKGASLVLINTNKGLETFNTLCKDKGVVKEVELQSFMQSHLSEPLKEPADRNKLWDLYLIKGFDFASKEASKKQNKIRKTNKRKAFMVKVLRKLKIKK